MLVNGEKESVVSNERVQECLGKARAVRKPIVRYIQVCIYSSVINFVAHDLNQLVENEEMIGALIETNERIITALQMYVNVGGPFPA